MEEVKLFSTIFLCSFLVFSLFVLYVVFIKLFIVFGACFSLIYAAMTILTSEWVIYKNTAEDKQFQPVYNTPNPFTSSLPSRSDLLILFGSSINFGGDTSIQTLVCAVMLQYCRLNKRIEVYS